MTSTDIEAFQPWTSPPPYTSYERRKHRRIAAEWTAAARDRVRGTYEQLSPEAKAEVMGALVRVRKARTPRQAVAALEYEIEHLFDAIAPVLIERPLPIRTPARAYATVAVVAGAAAAVDEIEAIALLIPGVDTAAIPTLPLVAAAAFSALVLEAYATASLRVHMLRAAGRPVDPHTVTRDTLRAMTGRQDVAITKSGAQLLARRMVRRWARGIVPFVGIGYASSDARRTIREITRMPL